MLVFAKQGLVFLAVPKTGTTAYAEALAPHASLVVRDPPELKHAPIWRYNRFFRPMLEKFAGEMETIAVVREPESWLGSWYRYRRRPFTRGKPVSTERLGFDAFVQGYLSEPQPAWARVGSQSAFLAPRRNGTAADHVFRYEAPGSLLDFLEARLGVRPAPARRNVSPEAPLELAPTTRAALREVCAEDYALWEGSR
ncbi:MULTISPECIES: gamma-glutamyl kinase [unclassified Rhodosalinus]|uniref:gamma-glutamyl kinase n=1 Tax=unclassified Rhodosalinus TaxID=2630183 RepID=UPI0035231466